MIPEVAGGVPAGDGERRAASGPTPFARVLSVETRKLLDTRSGMVLTVLLVVLTLAAVIGRGAVAGPHLDTLVYTAGVPFGTLLPVLGIRSVTGEWSHRTALVTFALEPRRHRVQAAKCLSAVVITVSASVLAIVVAVPATAGAAALQDVPADWDVGLPALAGWTATNVLIVAMGLAAGMLLLNAPAAVVICLASPALLTALGRMGPVGETLAGWLDLSATARPLAEGAMNGGDAARLAVAVLCWIVLPMAAGFARVLRKDVQ